MCIDLSAYKKDLRFFIEKNTINEHSIAEFNYSHYFSEKRKNAICNCKWSLEISEQLILILNCGLASILFFFFGTCSQLTWCWCLYIIISEVYSWITFIMLLLQIQSSGRNFVKNWCTLNTEWIPIINIRQTLYYTKNTNSKTLKMKINHKSWFVEYKIVIQIRKPLSLRKKIECVVWKLV